MEVRVPKISGPVSPKAVGAIPVGIGLAVVDMLGQVAVVVTVWLGTAPVDCCRLAISFGVSCLQAS